LIQITRRPEILEPLLHHLKKEVSQKSALEKFQSLLKRPLQLVQKFLLLLLLLSHHRKTRKKRPALNRSLRGKEEKIKLRRKGPLHRRDGIEKPNPQALQVLHHRPRQGKSQRRISREEKAEEGTRQAREEGIAPRPRIAGEAAPLPKQERSGEEEALH
jgi:hypothetical protein